MLVRFILAACAALACTAPAIANEARSVESCAVGGDLAVCHEVVVPAPASEVWSLWTTSAGLSSWAAPVAAIELRVGGTWEASYDRGARIGDTGNIRNRVVAFSPDRLLVIQIADAPPNFPHEELARQLATTIELEPVDGSRTLVRVTMIGYRNEPGFEVLRGHFERGNAWTLAKLYERVVSGPVDWNATLTQ